MKNTENQDCEITKLTPEILIYGYSQGVFPMAISDKIYWFSPEERGIIDFKNFKPGRHLRNLSKHHPFTIKINTNFEQVMRFCGERSDTWINEEIVQAFVKLHELGFSHSVECWHKNELLGGLYLVSLKGAVFGESMFSKATNASKIATLFLIERLKERNFQLLDAQYTTEHLSKFNCIEIPKSDYLERLNSALRVEADFAGGQKVFDPPDPAKPIHRIKIK